MLVCSLEDFNHSSVHPLQENIELALADTEPTSWGSVAAVDQPSHQALVSTHVFHGHHHSLSQLCCGHFHPQTCFHSVDEGLEALVLVRGRKGALRCFHEGLAVRVSLHVCSRPVLQGGWQGSLVVLRMLRLLPRVPSSFGYFGPQGTLIPGILQSLGVPVLGVLRNPKCFNP